MIGLILFGFGFVLGMLHGQGKLIPWVRGAAGKARDAVLGSRPAPRAMDAKVPLPSNTRVAMDAPSPEVSPTPPKNPIRAGDVLKLLGEVGKFIWHWRHFIVAGLIALVIWGFAARVVSFVTCPFGGILWCATDNDAAELENERTNTRIAQLEARVGALSGQLAENTARDQRRVTTIIAQANEDLDHAVEAVDPDLLYDVYRRSYDSVWNDLASGEPNPPANRPDRLPGAAANPT